jgi:putative transposase
VVFHIVNRSAKRVPLFEDPADYRAFEDILRQALARYDVALFAYCLMPNHWHFLLSPRADKMLPRFMHWLTTTHARRWQAARGTDGQGAVYQGRYKAIPVCADRYLWVCRYVERNALRAGLVGQAEDWHWSSLARRLRDEAEWLSEWPVGCPADWLAQVNIAQTLAEIDAFRRAMKLGQPYGDDASRAMLAAAMGIRLSNARGRRRRDPMAQVS